MSGSSRAITSRMRMALRRRHAGGGLVEQQHLRLQRQRDRDLDQPLAAVGQFAHQLERVLGEPQRVRDGRGLLDHRALAPAGRHRLLQAPLALGDRQVDVLQHGEPAKQLIDLERAGEAAPRALACGSPVMSSPSSSTRPAMGCSAPVIRLTSVVLPAPFGPISAWRAPRSSTRLMSRATASAPKLLCRPRTSRRGGHGFDLARWLARRRPRRAQAGRDARTAPSAPAPDRCRTARIPG